VLTYYVIHVCTEFGLEFHPKCMHWGVYIHPKGESSMAVSEFGCKSPSVGNFYYFKHK